MIVGLRPNSHLRRLGRGRWISLEDDPQFVFWSAPGAPPYALIELCAEGEALDAAVYLRDATGWTEARRMEFPASRRLLLVVNMAEGPARRGFRLDPCDSAGVTFRMRWWTRRRATALNRLTRTRMAHNPGLRPDLIGSDPGLKTGGARPRMPTFGRPALAQTLSRIWEAAGVEAATSPLPAPDGVVISLLCPVYNADAAHLDTLVDSVRTQAAGVELILSDDGSTRAETRAWLDRAGAAARQERDRRLTVLRAPDNCGIAAATNAALAAAQGAWVGLIDHDDALAPHAIDRIRRAFATCPDAAFLYTDEVIADMAMQPVGAFMKPGFDPVLLSGVNYVNHLSLYRRDRLNDVGGLREGFQGSQDYDLALRYCRGLPASALIHLPYPAYVWRQHAASLSHSRRDDATAAARRALAEQFSILPSGPAMATPALLPDLHRLRFAHPPRPLVSVIVPSRDSYPLISRVLDGLRARTDYAPMEIIVIDNGSQDPRVTALYAEQTTLGGFQAHVEPAPFNFAAMVNKGAALAQGEVLLLLNNDVAMLEPDWLSEMVECLAFPGVGVVGARLLYPNRTLQHAGVILGLGGLAGHWFYKAPVAEPGPMGRLSVRASMTTVTAACMLVDRACWDATGGMDAGRFAVAYNDIDFCVRARAADFGVVWTPFATLLHDESASRGADLVGERARRFVREKAALRMLHGTETVLDPCFSPWWSRYQSRPRLRLCDGLPAPRSFMGFDWAAPEGEDA